MTPSTTHPLIATYLDELERLLADIDPDERADVLSGVREHLDTALASNVRVGDDEVRAALGELGPPQLLADEAHAGSRPTIGIPPADAGYLGRRWVPVVVAVLTALGLLLAVLVVGSMASVSSSSSSSGNAGGSPTAVQTTEELTGSPVAGSFIALLATLPLWVPVAVLVGLSPLWVRREKVVASLLVPAAALLLGVLPEVGWALRGSTGVYVGAWTALILVLAGGGWTLVRQTARSAARAHRPAS
jgi:hypothetical protein